MLSIRVPVCKRRRSAVPFARLEFRLCRLRIAVCAGGGKMQPDSAAGASPHTDARLLDADDFIALEPLATADSPPDARTIFEEIERRVGQRNFRHWFDGQTSLDVCEDRLVVGVRSPFVLRLMQKQFGADVSAVAQSLFGPAARSQFEVNGVLLQTAAEPAAAESTASDSSAGSTIVSKPESKSPKRGGRAIERQNADEDGDQETPLVRPGRRFQDLEDFVVGGCNELAAAAARQVVDAPGVRYSPLFLYGGVGTGKTHLLEGVYRGVRRRYPALQVMFLTAEAFTNYFTEALREHNLPSFRQRFRGVDVFLVDDVDFLDGKRSIQEEFLHTCQQLESRGRQIVLSADRHPRLLTKTSEELTTRFVSGLACRLESPDAQTRGGIVARKAQKLEGDFAPEALDFVAERFRNNVRELEGALHCLDTLSHMTGRRVTATAARRVLAGLERDCIRIVRMTDVEQAVCGFFGVEVEDLRSSSRRRSVSQPRMLAMFLTRKLTSAAYSEIGRHFGGRNHSTVISAEKTVEGWMRDGAPVKIASDSWPVEEVLETIEEQLHGA